MDICRVSLFGHHDFCAHEAVERKIRKIFKDLLCAYEAIEVYIGRNGEFDIYAASVIKLFRKSVGCERCELTLVLPYKVRDIEHYEKYYDNILIPVKTYPKSAIVERNKWMVDNSDIVLVYVEKTNGGAYSAMKYAEKSDKKVVNLASMDMKKLN